MNITDLFDAFEILDIQEYMREQEENNK